MIGYEWCNSPHDFDEQQEVAAPVDRLVIFEQIVKASPQIEPYRSGGFMSHSCDRARVYVDLPIVEAKKLLKALKEI